MKMKLNFTLLLMLIASISFGQALTGGIAGKVLDADGKPLDYASVKVVEGGLVKGGAYTDENGNFSIKPLNVGSYDINVSYTGLQSTIVKGVQVSPSKTASRTIVLTKGSKTQLGPVVITGVKLIDPNDPGGDQLDAETMKNQATTSVIDMVAITAGVKQTGGNLSIGGERTGGTQYFIDGVPVLGNRAVNLSPRAIGRAQVMRTGMAAKFGNATGGIVQLTSAPVSAKTTGGLQAQTSVDGYFNNLISLDLSGPLYSKNRKSADKKIVLGYFINLAGRYNRDPSPSYLKYNVLKPEVLESIQETPLLPNPSGIGSFIEAAETVTADDFREIKAREQGDNYNINYLGKLDFQPTTKVNLTLGTYFDYTKFRNFNRLNSMFSPAANGQNNSYTGRAYVRFSQSLGRAATGERDSTIKKSSFSNAFYTVQASYQRDYSDAANPVHGRNIFDYGYLGKFTQERTPIYVQDTASGIGNNQYLGWKYLTDFSTDMTFTRGGINPLLENYTAQIMNNPAYDVNNLVQLQSLGGLLNGDGPGSSFGLYTGAGAQIGSYSYSQEDRFNLNLDASFDLEQGMNRKNSKNRIVHAIEFGMGYEQRTNRNYFLNASSLYPLMRLFTNTHLQNLDLDNPIFVVGGQNYTKQQLADGVVEFSEFDTIKYNRLPVAADQTRFDKSLREKMFGSANTSDIIDVFDLSPSTFSLDMFSADDLYNSGSGFANQYNGYDYLGNIQRQQPSFNDFWTKKDGRGDYSRPIAAYNPNYMFGYIQDNFTYKDINFNIGVRFDRFDANQNVLRDPYSLYGIRDLSTYEADFFKPAYDESAKTDAPDPIKAGFNKDWIPYIDNNQASKPTVVGYRSGDTWFDPFGREIADPTVLSEKYANGLPIQPALVDPNDSIKSENYKVGNAFEDYTPDVAVSPRLQFTFPISDKSLFYGNYDIVTQYPTGRNFASPDDYYFITERRQTLNNANLRMNRSINYTLGFEQAITTRSKVGLEVAYSERKDQVQLQQFILAYPLTYTSYGNRDFSSTKRFIFKYDLRRDPNKFSPVTMRVAYTLQFAEGTGSNTTSTQSLIASGQPNLRTLFPLSFDSRHQFNVVFNYLVAPETGPSWKGKDGKEQFLLSGVAANLQLNANSGEPFTRSSLATPIVGGDFNSVPIIGTVNGSRLPWFQDVRLRVQKSMIVGKIGRKKDENGKILTKTGRPVTMNVYTFIQNLLNTRNVVGVYQYTGVADDDGYLNSPQGQQALQTTFINPQSYIDLYNQRIASPANYGAPRRINVGFTLSF